MSTVLLAVGVLSLAVDAGSAEITLRPGMPTGNGCTFNFLFVGSDGQRYMGTAGHCMLDENGREIVWPAEGAPEWRDEVGFYSGSSSEGVLLGERAYAIWNERALAAGPPDDTLPMPADFGLIRLAPTVAAEPAVCHFGGPTGVNDDVAPGVSVGRAFGTGEGIGMLQELGLWLLPGRPVLLHDLTDPRFARMKAPRLERRLGNAGPRRARPSDRQPLRPRRSGYLRAHASVATDASRGAGERFARNRSLPPDRAGSSFDRTDRARRMRLIPAAVRSKSGTT